MTTHLQSSQAAPPRGLRNLLRTRFWQGLDSSTGYRRTLRTVTRLLEQPYLWSDNQLLHRLCSLQQLAEIRPKDGKTEISANDSARKDYLTAIRNLLGPRLKRLTPDSERRRANCFLAWAEAHLGIEDPYCRPFRARLELTDACNLRCEMCLQSVIDFKPAFMTPETLAGLESSFPWLTDLDFTSFGETLLAPLFETALRKVPNHVRTTLISNGLLLDEPRARLLIEAGLGQLQVSIDGATPKTYLALRGVDRFERIVENCRRMAVLKKQAGSPSPRLMFNYTLRRRNFDEVSPLLRLAAEIGFEAVQLNYLQVVRDSIRDDSVYWIRAEVCEALDRWEEEARDLGLEFIHPPKPVPVESSSEPVIRLCRDPWEFIYFRAKGNLGVCCMAADEFAPGPGVDWETVWHSEPYRSFRRRVNLPTEEAPALCQTCYLACNIPTGDPRYHFFVDQVNEYMQDQAKEVPATTTVVALPE